MCDSPAHCCDTDRRTFGWMLGRYLRWTQCSHSHIEIVSMFVRRFQWFCIWHSFSARMPHISHDMNCRNRYIWMEEKTHILAFHQKNPMRKLPIQKTLTLIPSTLDSKVPHRNNYNGPASYTNASRIDVDSRTSLADDDCRSIVRALKSPSLSVYATAGHVTVPTHC